MTKEFAVVEIPHQLPPKIWSGTEKFIIEMAGTVHGFYYNIFDSETALNAYGGIDEIPDELKTLLAVSDEVLHYGWGCNDSFFCLLSKAENELELAMGAIGHDLYTCHLVPVHELPAFIESYNGHQNYELTREYARFSK